MRDQSFSFCSSFFSSSPLHTNHEIGSNSQAHTLIQLIFGTLVGCIQANSGTNFGDNTAQFHGGTNVYLHIERSNFRHAYRVNRAWNKLEFSMWLDWTLEARAVLEISLSSFQIACLSQTRTVKSSCRVSIDAVTQIFAKVSNFPSWRPKKVFTTFP